MANKTEAQTQTETLVEIAEFDTREMVLVFAANVAKAIDSLTDPEIQKNPHKLGDLRDNIAELYKFGIEVNKMGRELQSKYDDMVTLMYELDIDGFNVQKLYTPKPRNSAGRRKMTAQERIAAAQKRVVEKD